MASFQRFAPAYGGGQVVSATSSSATKTITKNSLSVRVTNFDAANVAYVKVGHGSISASTADYPVRANSEIWITKGTADDTIAYYSASGASLHIITGEGF